MMFDLTRRWNVGLLGEAENSAASVRIFDTQENMAFTG
jgi:hypothetical protein